jgi:hypothetical protein
VAETPNSKQLSYENRILTQSEITVPKAYDLFRPNREMQDVFSRQKDCVWKIFPVLNPKFSTTLDLVDFALG